MVLFDVRYNGRVLIRPTSHRRRLLQNRPNYAGAAASFLVNKLLLIAFQPTTKNTKMFVAWFVGWLIRDHLLLRDYGPYGIIFMNVCCYNCCHGNSVKGFWALCLLSIYWLVIICC
jgi:hypothetical protein